MLLAMETLNVIGAFQSASLAVVLIVSHIVVFFFFPVNFELITRG